MKLIYIFIKSIVIVLFLTLSYAATDNELLQDIKTNTEEISTKTTTFWGNYLTNYLGLNIAGVPLVPFTPTTPGVNALVFQKIKEKADLMAQSSTNDAQAIINSSMQYTGPDSPTGLNMENYINIGGDFYGITPTGDMPIGPKNPSLNVDSLIGQSAIENLDSVTKSNEKGLNAKNFILLVAGAANPTAVKNRDIFSSDEEYQAHLGYVWALNAQQGVALSNLYHVLRQREIIPGLGRDADLRNDDNTIKPDASILEVEESRILKRVGDPNWYTAMESAAPIQIERESLYILAEIQRLLHLTRKQNERMLVSFSTLIAQGLDLRKALNAQADAMSSAGDNITVPDIPES